MKSKPVITLPMLNAAIAQAEAKHAEARTAGDVAKLVQTKSDLNRARAALRQFIYRAKSLGGHCNLIRH